MSLHATAVLAAFATLLALASSQEPAAAEPTRAAALLATLDRDHTDWLALRDVGDKLPALGAVARDALERALAAAATRDDRRHEIRLRGVLARLDADAVPRLGTWIGDDDERLAALAARVLGRCGADADAVARELGQRLRAERRLPVAAALALATADAGAKTAAVMIEGRLRAAPLRDGDAKWLQQALARLRPNADRALVRSWLTDVPAMAAVGVLAARLHRHDEIERLLLARLEQLDGRGAASDDELAWLLQALGGAGGAPTVRALRAQVGDPREGAILSTHLDPRRIALLRLGDADALAWALAAVRSNGSGEAGGITMQVMGPDLARLPELIGKWRLANAAACLQELLADRSIASWSRAHAARGLCWMHDIGGLRASAALLADARDVLREFPGDKALECALATLHDFVGNADRPDYVPLDERAAEERAVAAGAAWQAWLAREPKIVWREPWCDDLLLWR